MQRSPLRYLFSKTISWIILLFFSGITIVSAEKSATQQTTTVERTQVIAQQISLLQNSYKQNQRELADLEKEHDEQITQLTIEKTNKNLLDKASLDILVARSNLDSINIELADSQQAINWLEKNIQEIENQLNVLNIFGLTTAPSAISDREELQSDANYQKKLLQLEKSKLAYLQKLQTTGNAILKLKKEKYNRINTLLKSRNMLLIKQQQMRDELLYQEQQQQWLKQLNLYNQQLTKVDPIRSKQTYLTLERNIFYANENANLAYSQSLIARYKDQIQQMKLGVLKSNSISLLNEISDQAQAISKQINRLNAILNAREGLIDKHMNALAKKRENIDQTQPYLRKLATLETQYQLIMKAVAELNKNLANFRVSLDQALQAELSARQGLPSFELKTLLDLGKEMLLVPALAFQVIKNLSAQILKAWQATSFFKWSMLVLLQSSFLVIFIFLYRWILTLLARPAEWKEQINSKWLSLNWWHHHFFELVLLGNVSFIMYFLSIPFKNFAFIIYLALVWVAFKSIIVVSRICLVETTHNRAGHDVRLYYHLRWILLIGGSIIALMVSLHQLPLIYELKTLCDQLFLLFLFIVSLLLLRSWEAIPHLILSQIEADRPYLQRCIRLIGILIPLLMLGNSVIGLLGFMNLIMTIAWYEGVFLLVLIGYLILRGLLSDGMEHLSSLTIQYAYNGWLWTEAFLKPLDKILRITLFLSAWATLFISYGWDQQSPIVERLNGLLHYRLASILNTVITPLSIIELFVLISVFYWVAKWIREFVYRALSSKTKDMGVRNTIAILSQYSVVIFGGLFCMRVLGIDLAALTVVAGAFAFGVGIGLRDLANNFACGFLILLERPLRVGDIVNINGIEGDVIHIGGRAVTVKTWDHMELVVPNTEIFNKSFTNWTARDNTVRTVFSIKIDRLDNPHLVKEIIYTTITEKKDILHDPIPEVFLRAIGDTSIEFEVRYFVNIRTVKSRVAVLSGVLLALWDAFAQHGIKPSYPQHEVFLRNNASPMSQLQHLPR